MDFRNLKIVRKLKNIAPKIKWVMFKNIQDYKINSEYIDYIIPEEKKSVEFDNIKLENMVKESLIKEFGPCEIHRLSFLKNILGEKKWT